MDSDFSVNEEVNSTLIDWQVCTRCRTRLLNKDIDFENFNIVHETENWICYLCTGILQETSINTEIIDKIKADILKSNFKYQSFQLVVSTPINLLIREFSVILALKDKYKELSFNDVVQIKSVWRNLVKNNLSCLLDKLCVSGTEVQIARNSKNCLLGNDFLIVNINFSHPKVNNECAVLAELEPELFKQRRKGEHRYKWELFTRKITEKILQNTTKEKFQRYFGSPPYHNKNDAISDFTVEICRQNPVIIAGRYLKRSRRLPQSPWIFDGVRKLDSSVEELVSEKLISTFQCSDSCFIASGREDVDVRMLGKGRPFVVELKNCKNMVRDFIDKIDELQNEINVFCEDRLQIRDLKIISIDSVNLIKQGEEEKPKQYRMVVWCENGINDQEIELLDINKTRDLLVQQLTPIRVLHRRSLIDRSKIFYSFHARRLDYALSEEALKSDQTLQDYVRFLQNYDSNHLFVLNLRCQAGSYVKEFVHGDLGRTRPNLATIMGQQCDILALDVMEIELEWPPKY